MRTRRIIHVQATKPAINAAKKPPTRETVEISLTDEVPCLKRSIVFNSAAPKIGGSTIRNENLAAFDLSTPRNRAVVIVAPEREIPGMIATA